MARKKPTAPIPAAGAHAFGDLRQSGGPQLPNRPAPFDASGADPRETFRKMCPACGSHDVRIVIPDGPDDNMLKFDNLKMFQDRRCKACGRRWTPACPRWAGYCCIAAGVLLFVFAGAIAIVCADGRGVEAVLVMGLVFGSLPAVFGGFCLVYGIGTLAGRLGRLRMR